MKTSNALRPSGTQPLSSGGDRRRGRPKKSHHIDIVWILLWIVLIVGLVLTMALFYAVMTPSPNL